jgi:Lipoprotein LpqB beta-propeller domain/Sporulation and spore germination
MTLARRRLAGILIVIASLLAAAGCVSVPTSGPIEKLEGQQPPVAGVNVEVAPPEAGADPKEIVEGYLRATSNYQPNYSVARQFLTRMASEKWSPESGVTIYRGSPKAIDPDTVQLGGQQIGSLLRDRTYLAQDQKLQKNFNLVQENREWRIDDLPPGLMVAERSFRYFYQSYDLYFIGNGVSLVPQTIYLPALSNPANVASALMKALLNGPSDWLKPAVTTALPPNTSLNVDSVTITNGIAVVPLSDSVLALPDRQRSLLAAQIVYTLRQVGGVKGVLIKANEQPYRVPGSDSNSMVISIDAIPQNMDPVPFVAGDQLYAVQGGAVKRVTATTDSLTVENLDGPLAGRTPPVDALAVSATNTDFAVTSNGRTVLSQGSITSGEMSPLPLRGVRELLPPQFSRYGEIWDIGYEGNKQQLWRFTGDGAKTRTDKIELPVVKDAKVTAFKISPDGTRIAVVRSGTGSQLWLARVRRSDKITVDGWRPLDTTQTNMPQIRKIADVAWIDATELFVLGAPDTDMAYAPYRVVEDASRITEQGNRENWSPVKLGVSPRRQTAIIVDAAGQTWKYDNQWSPFMKAKVNSIAYPG